MKISMQIDAAGWRLQRYTERRRGRDWRTWYVTAGRLYVLMSRPLR